MNKYNSKFNHTKANKKSKKNLTLAITLKIALFFSFVIHALFIYTLSSIHNNLIIFLFGIFLHSILGFLAISAFSSIVNNSSRQYYRLFLLNKGYIIFTPVFIFFYVFIVFLFSKNIIDVYRKSFFILSVILSSILNILIIMANKLYIPRITKMNSADKDKSINLNEMDNNDTKQQIDK